jgi:hypothetical protein
LPIMAIMQMTFFSSDKYFIELKAYWKILNLWGIMASNCPYLLHADTARSRTHIYIDSYVKHVWKKRHK